MTSAGVPGVDRSGDVDGPLLVLAGPGTGKTRAIVERVARLVESGRARPEDLLVLTFSRRAAREMRERIHDRLPMSYTSFFIGTFHSLALSLITRHYAWLGYTERPRLLTSEEQWSRVARMSRSDDARLWPHYANLRNLRSFTQQVFDFVLRAQEYLLTPDGVRARAEQHGRRDWREVAEFMERYLASIRAEGFVDYGGMMSDAVGLLEQREDVREALQQQYRYILVDEYQDTNHAQDRVIELLAGERRNLFVVGDPDQSIYAFRGATIENILTFADRYGAETVELGTNYRAAPELVAAATTLIRNNRQTHRERSLEPAAAASAGHVIGVRFASASDELHFVASEARRLHADEQVPYREMAVLVRSLRGVAAHLDGVLAHHAVPHRVLGGGIRLYEHAFVRPMLGLLRLSLEVPTDRDAEIEAVGAILSSPLFDVDPLAVRALQREARLMRASMLDVLRSPPEEARLSDSCREAAGGFRAILRALAARAQTASVDALVQKVWEALPACRRLVDEEDLENIGAIRELYASTVRFTERHPGANLGEFLALTEAGDLGQDPWLEHHDDAADALKVMTIHQAKGLEFDVVFVPGLVEGAFPNLSRGPALVDRGIFAGAAPESRADEKAKGLEEERRVCYVALTRARRRAYLTAVDDPEDASDAQVSRFFKELEPALTGTERPRPARRFVSLADAVRAFRRTLADPAASDLDKALAVAGVRAVPGADPSAWWGSLEETRNARPLYPDGLPRLSYTALSLYENCPQRFVYERELDLVRREGPALSFGSLVHSVLERFLSPECEVRTLERLLQLGEAVFDEADFGKRVVAHQMRRKLEQTLRDFFRLGYQPGGVRLLEREFEIEIDGVRLRGKIDRVDVEPDGLRVVDYKTGPAATEAKAAEDLQLGIYYLACVGDPDLAALGAPKELVYVYVQEPRVRGLATRRQPIGPGHRERIEDRLRAIFERMRAEEIGWSADADCRFCSFTTVCRRWPQGNDVPL